jgi:hypothetical protein
MMGLPDLNASKLGVMREVKMARMRPDQTMQSALLRAAA